MLPGYWYVVLESKEIPAGRLVGARRLGLDLVFWRDEAGRVQALTDRCCHRGASLAAGRLSGDHVACPFHGFVHDGQGKVVTIPGNGRQTPVPSNFHVQSWPCREAHGFVYLFHQPGDLPDPLPELPFFDELNEGFAYDTFVDPWPVHYTRAIENQLDVLHLPFVHDTTIGRGGKTLVNGPGVTWRGDVLEVIVHNSADEGKPPLKPSEVTMEQAATLLRFQLPNLWQNRLSPKMSVLAAFVPVDEENTLIYIRFYQRFVTVPILRTVVGWFMQLANGLILNQDKRVVLTQRPKKTWLTMGENLVQGDLPIVMFRRRRAEILQEPKAS